MKKIIVAIDCSDISERVIDFACELAMGRETTLHVVSVTREQGDLTPSIWQQVEGIFRSQANELLAAADSRIRAAGIDRIEIENLLGDPAITIVDYATKTQADAIIVGSHGQSQISGLLLGSVSFKVLSLAQCPVIVVK